MPEQQSQFAPLYSRRERWRILLWALLITGLLAIVMFLWVLPWLKDFLPTAHCQTILGINGLSAVMILMFVASPLILMIFLLITEGPKSWHVYQLKQSPLPGEKTMKPTRYRYGQSALWRPFGFLLIICGLLALSVWALSLINDFSDSIENKANTCPEAQLINKKHTK